MKTTIAWKTLIIEGKRFELWGDAERSFGYTAQDLESFVRNGRWELLFNALTIAAMQAAESRRPLGPMYTPTPRPIAAQ